MFNLFKIFQIISIVLIHSITLHSQKISREWVARFNHTSDDKAHQIVIDNIGNVYVVGESDASPNGYTDYVTLKYNNNGVLQWARFYDGLPNNQNNDRARSVTVDISGNCYVTGYSNSIPFPYGDNLDIVTIKYDTAGNTIWTHRFDAGLTDGGDIIKIDNSGNIVVAGTSMLLQTLQDYIILKYDPNGTLLWAKRFDYANNRDYVRSMVIDNQNNIYVTGVFSATANADYGTIKYNSSGDILWVAVYDGPTSYSVDESNDIAVDNFGNVYVTGQSWGGSTWTDIVTVKYDSSGNELWVARYNGNPGTYGLHDKGIGVVVDDSGFAYVTGWSSVTDDADIVLIKYDQRGDTVWTRRYNGPGNSYDFPYDITLDRNGNIYIAGYSFGTSDNADYIVLKYNPEGLLIWAERYNGPGNGADVASSIVVDSKDNVYVTGWSRSSGNLDIATIKYSQTTTSVQNISAEVPDNFYLFQNYPNPFNSSTKIKFTVPFAETPLNAPSLVMLKVYDVLGREIATLVDEYKPSGNFEVEYSSKKELSSGIYYYQLIAGNFIETKKMILLR